ncbi:hypothetical protein [Siminovitchia sp. 179-K 8D1 HS]
MKKLKKTPVVMFAAVLLMSVFWQGVEKAPRGEVPEKKLST